MQRGGRSLSRGLKNQQRRQLRRVPATGEHLGEDRHGRAGGSGAQPHADAAKQAGLPGGRGDQLAVAGADAVQQVDAQCTQASPGPGAVRGRARWRRG